MQLSPMRPASRRGRPKINRPRRDYGTAELIEKRKNGETSEVLDLCMERGLITTKHHWCGIHLRWLYTLRYGTPSVQATQLMFDAPISPRSNDSKWQTAREEEYQSAIIVLTNAGCATTVMNVCIFNERPGFLKSGMINSVREKEFFRFTHGLDLLEDCWCKTTAEG